MMVSQSLSAGMIQAMLLLTIAFPFARLLIRRSTVMDPLPTALAVLCLAGSVVAAEPSELTPVAVSSEPSPKSPTITASGTVTDEEGNPLEDASVVLRANLGGVQYAPGLQHARDVLARTTTDSKGRFRFTEIGLPPRLVGNIDELRQARPGAQVLVWADGAALQWKAIESFNEEGLEFRLPDAADVAGIATDENGEPLASGTLNVTGIFKGIDSYDGFLEAPGDLNLIRSEVVFLAAVHEGRFRIENMPQGYGIAARFESPSGHRSFFVIDTGNGSSTEIAVPNSRRDPIPVHRPPMRITAKQQPWVKIRVVDHEGHPVTVGGVEAVDSERHYGGSAAVNKEGTATLIVNTPGVHDVYYAGDPLHPKLGFLQSIDIQPESEGIIEMKLPVSRILVGRVVDSDTGAPVPGVYVSGNHADDESTKPRVTGSMAVSDAEGRFKLPVAVGVYRLSIRHEVDGYFVPTFANRRSVEPAPEEHFVKITAEDALPETVIKIGRGLVVNGTVLDEQGMPAREIRVRVSSEGASYRQTVTVTDAEGHFRFTGLSPYVPTRITASSESGVADEMIAPTERHPWEQTLTKSAALKLVRGSSLAGRVTQSGRPIAGVRVSLRRAGPRKPNEQGVRFSLFGETITDAQGKYRLPGLLKGDRYYVEVETQAGAEVRDWQYASPYSHTVAVENGTTIELPDAELKTNGQTLSGVVVDPDGNPVEGITVSASLASGGHLSRPQNGPPPWTETDSNGRFTLTHLPDEPISLMAYKSNPAGGRILYPSHASPGLNADDIRILLDPRLTEAPEDLD